MTLNLKPSANKVIYFYKLKSVFFDIRNNAVNNLFFKNSV